MRFTAPAYPRPYNHAPCPHRSTFNERENAGELIQRLDSVLRGIECEVIIVDDDFPTAPQTRCASWRGPRRPVRFAELPCEFRPRRRGESKLDLLVGLEYLQLLVHKRFGDILPPRPP